jgi:hypothetical protein
MVMCGCGLLTGRPLLVGAAITTVGGDQLCWYLDLAGYALFSKFPVGVAKYLTYPENRTFVRWLTSVHHLWFMPFCIWVLCGHGGMRMHSFYLSFAFTMALAAYARLFSPFQLKAPGQEQLLYLNINGCHEFWKDVKIGLLHYMDGQHPLIYLPYLMLVGNTAVNGIPHLLAYTVSQALEPARST